MFYSQRKDPDIEILEDQLQQYQDDERRRQEESAEQRTQREQDRKERWEIECRNAETWPEALSKQAILMAKEARYETTADDDEFGTYFTDSVKACNRALEIWREIESAKQSKVEELQRQLESARDEIRLEVAQKLASESDTIGWRGVASSIEEDALEGWLDW